MTHLQGVLKALADLSRLRILNILFQGEVCVCDMQSVLGLSQPFLSRHLAYLRNAGLIADRREGPRVFYQLTLEGELGGAVEKFLQSLFPLFETFERDSLRRGEFSACCQDLEKAQEGKANPLASSS